MRRVIGTGLIGLTAAMLASGADLLVPVYKFTSEQVAARKVTLTLLEPGPVTAGPWLIAGDWVSKLSDKGGQVVFSNVLAGGYRLDISGNPSRRFPIGVPDTNGLINAASLVGATNVQPLYYSAAQIDARLGAVTNTVKAIEKGGARSHELYVNSADGNDSNDGSTWQLAKRTLLAAYDGLDVNGGTIRFADGALVGGATNQGLWFMGTFDPNYGQPGYPSASNPVGTNGWRKYKPVHWLGDGGAAVDHAFQFARPAVATIQPGQGGTWAIATNKPAIWLSSCESGMWFENVAIVDCPKPVILGTDSTGGTCGRQTALVWFDKCALRCPSGPVADTDDGVSGPVVDSKFVFWVYFADCTLQGYYGASATNDRRAVFLTKPAAPLNQSAGLISFDRCTFVGGGVKYYVGTTSGGFTMTDVVEEGPFTKTNAPPAWIIGPTKDLAVRIKRVSLADAYLPSGMRTVQIDAPSVDYNPSANIIVDDVDVVGPAVVMGTGGQIKLTSSPHLQRQTGIAFDTVWGKTHALRANWPPVFVPFTNCWSGALPANAEWVKDPLGTTNAIRGTQTGSGRFDVKLASWQNHPISVGDYVVFGAWIRVPGGLGQDAGLCTMGFDTDPGTQLAQKIYNFPSFNHAGWQWVSAFSKIAAVGQNPSPLFASVYYYANNVTEIFQPTLLHIPAGMMNENDVAELATQMAGWPGGLVVGSLATQKGQRFAMWDAGTNDWRYLDINGGLPRVTLGNGTLTGAASNLVSWSAIAPTNKMDAIGGASMNQVLKWNGVAWVPGNDDTMAAGSLPTNLFASSLVVTQGTGSVTLTNGSGVFSNSAGGGWNGILEVRGASSPATNNTPLLSVGGARGLMIIDKYAGLNATAIAPFPLAGDLWIHENWTAMKIRPPVLLYGGLTWNTDNTQDVGASGANRPRDIFAGRNGVFGGAVTASLGTIYPQQASAPAAATIGGTVGSLTNHILVNVGGKLTDYWSDGATVWSKQLGP